VFQNYFNEIVYAQVFNDLEIDIPIFVFAPNMVIMTTINKPLTNMYFSDGSTEINPFDKPDKLFENEIINSLNCSFTSSFIEDSNFIVNAFIKKKQLFYIHNSVSENAQQLTISSPNGEVSKQVDYKNGRLEKVLIKNQSDLDIIGYSYIGDSIILKKSFNTSKLKYDFFEERFKNELIQSKIFYKKSNNPEARIVKKLINFYYDENNRLLKETTANNQDKVIDSTSYFYKNSLLIGVIKYVKDAQNSILYQYNAKDLPEKKSIFTKGKQVDLNLVYDDNNRVESIEIKSQGSSYWRKCFFYFNQDSKLIAMKTYRINQEDEQLYFRSQYLFSYMNDGMLQSLKAVDEKGNITKEVVYELEYVSNK